MPVHEIQLVPRKVRVNRALEWTIDHGELSHCTAAPGEYFAIDLRDAIALHRIGESARSHPMDQRLFEYWIDLGFIDPLP